MKEVLGVSHPTARSTVQALQRIGILQEFNPEVRWGKAFIAGEIYAVIRGDEQDAT